MGLTAQEDATVKSNNDLRLSKPLYDHNGKWFPTIRAMAKAYHIPDPTLRARIRYGWTLEQALTTPLTRKPIVRKPVCTDHLGKEFSSIRQMAEAHGISYQAVLDRLNRGWDTEKALTTPILNKNRHVVVKDHLGNIYPSRRALAKAYGISYVTMQQRFRIGWDLERVLTSPVRPHRTSPEDAETQEE